MAAETAARFGEQLRAVRAQRGMSLSQLARRIPCNKGYLSRVEHGHRMPSPTLAQLCDEILSARGALVDAATYRPAPVPPGSPGPAMQTAYDVPSFGERYRRTSGFRQALALTPGTVVPA